MIISTLVPAKLVKPDIELTLGRPLIIRRTTDQILTLIFKVHARNVGPSPLLVCLARTHLGLRQVGRSGGLFVSRPGLDEAIPRSRRADWFVLPPGGRRVETLIGYASLHQSGKAAVRAELGNGFGRFYDVETSQQIRRLAARVSMLRLTVVSPGVEVRFQ